MDVGDGEVQQRPPLAPSEKHNAAFPRKPRMKEISSRYLSSTATSRRSPSPGLIRASTEPAHGRSQSAERRRPPRQPLPSRNSTPSSPSRPSRSRPSTPLKEPCIDMSISSRRPGSGRCSDGLWPSFRNLSISIQSDTFSLPASRKGRQSSDIASKPSSTVIHRQTESSVRKANPERTATPLRGKSVDLRENSRPLDHSLAKSVDQLRWPGRVNGKLPSHVLSRSIDLSDRIHCAVSPVRKPIAPDPTIRLMQNSGSVTVRSLSLDVTGRKVTNFSSQRTSESSTSVIGPKRTSSAPLPVHRRPPSPSKASVAPPIASKRMPSPSRARPSLSSASTSSSSSQSSTSPSVFSFIADVRRGKKASTQSEESHQLRLLYNRYLQWRFLNAQADATLARQKISVEDLLFNAWGTISELRNSVMLKRIALQQLKQQIKLVSIMRDHMIYLDDWALMDREHSTSVAGAIEALEACILRVPITGGARVDIHMVKEAISSAIDVMQTMSLSIIRLLSKVEGLSPLARELANVASEARIQLSCCGKLLTSVARLQVEESSQRVHLMQLKEALEDSKSILSI